MTARDCTAAGGHRHRRKFTEGLLDTEKILGRLNLGPGQVVVDAGCGNGYMAKVFSHRVALSGKVYALDIEDHAMAVLESETRGGNIETMVGDITGKTPIAAASVDLVYISTVIHAFSKTRMTGFVDEVRRVLKPPGMLAIVEIKKIETDFGPPLSVRFSPEELRAAVPMVPVETLSVAAHFYMQTFRRA